MNKIMNKIEKIKETAWLFAGGGMQETAAKTIVELGYKLILTDENPDCVCRKYAEEFIPLSTFDIKGNLNVAKKIRNKYKIKAVFTAGADCHEAVAIIAKFLGVHSINPKISNICRYKFKTREVLSKAGIPQPKFAKVKTLNEAKKTIAKIGIPAVLKASNNAGSRGFSKIEKATDLNEESLKKAIDNGTTGYAILEELLTPVENEIAEQSVETLWYNGKMYWLNWVDRLFRKDFLLFKSIEKNTYANMPWGIELGHINPAVHDLKIKKQIKSMIKKVGLAIGMGEERGGHILKVDTMLTKNGFYILELTPRLSGGWDSAYTTPRRGANFIGGAIKIALGEKLDSDLWAEYFQYKNPKLFSSMLTLISKGAKDCMGRRFAYGSAFKREDAVKNAYKSLLAGKFIS